jgi:SAM-dependent methyltransferase
VKREDWDARYAQEGLLWSATPNRFLVAEVSDLQAGRGLDLACGEGQNSIWLAGRGWRMLGVDYSSVAVDKARRRAEREGVAAEFVCDDLLTYEPEANAFDLVVALYLHVLAEERRLVLERAAGALAPGGTFLLLGHDLTNIADGVGGPSNPSILYTPDDIAGELPGLDIEKAERVLRDVDGEERDAIDALVRARRPEAA